MAGYYAKPDTQSLPLYFGGQCARRVDCSPQCTGLLGCTQRLANKLKLVGSLHTALDERIGNAPGMPIIRIPCANNAQVLRSARIPQVLEIFTVQSVRLYDAV